MTQINEMTLRIPGIAPEEGVAMGREVARLLAGSLPADGPDIKIGELNIKLDAAQVKDPAQMASHIAEQIIRQIKWSGPR